MYHSGQTGLQIFLSVLECSLFGAYKSLTGSVETDSNSRENCAYKTRAGKKRGRLGSRQSGCPSVHPSVRVFIPPTPQAMNADSFQDREPNLVAALFPQATGSHDEDQLDDGLLSVSPLKQRHLMWSCLLTGPTGLICTSALIDSDAHMVLIKASVVRRLGLQPIKLPIHSTPRTRPTSSLSLPPPLPTSSSATPCAPNRRSFTCTETAAHEHYRRAYSTTKPSRPPCARTSSRSTTAATATRRVRRARPGWFSTRALHGTGSALMAPRQRTCSSSETVSERPSRCSS